MEYYDYRFRRSQPPAFDKVPAEHRIRLFDVEYVRLRGKQGGELFVTRYGWQCIESVLPQSWFVGDRFKKEGRALAGATGAVYRVPVEHPIRSDFALVVKFSRAAQDIRVTVVDSGAHLSIEERNSIHQAEFLPPFEEFGNVCKLRRQAGLAAPTAQPLAIYSPPTRYHDWQLGRKPYLCRRMDTRLKEAQSDVPENQRIRYDWERLYVVIYRWVDGVDAEAAMLGGALSQQQMTELGEQARTAMRDHGWITCDHKPRHVIIRRQRFGDDWIRRHDRIKWMLIDYELLFPYQPQCPAEPERDVDGNANRRLL